MTPRVHVTYDPPGILDRHFDYHATYAGDEPDDDGNMDIGYGATERDAIFDLLDNYPRDDEGEAA